jgi:hypothetical protein
MLHGDALVDRSAVLSALGRCDAAMHDLDEASQLFEQKGVTVSLASARRSYRSISASNDSVVDRD